MATVMVCLMLQPVLMAQSEIIISPEYQQVALSQSFTVDIEVGNVNNLFAFAAELHYDQDILYPVSFIEGSVLNEGGTVNTFFSHHHVHDQGKIILGVSRLDNSLPGVDVTAPETMLTIVFQAIGAGTSNLTLENTGLIAPDGSSTYNATIHNGSVLVTQTLQSVSVFVNPNNFIGEPNDTFEMDILLGAVNDLMAIAVTVNYDPQVVTLLTVTEGDFMNEHGTTPTSFMKQINNNTGECLIGLTRLTNPPSGLSSNSNNTVVTLHLKANNAGSSQITLSEAGLINPDGISVFQPVVSHGQVQVMLEPDHAELSFAPASHSVMIQHPFESMLMLNDVQDLYAVAFDINYNPSVVSIVEIEEGELLSEGGITETVFLHSIDNLIGKAVVGITRIGTTTGVGTAVPTELVNVKFASVNGGTATVFLSHVGLLEPDGITNLDVLHHSMQVDVDGEQGMGSINIFSVSQRQDGSGKIDVYYSLMAPPGTYNLQLEVSFNGEDNYQPVANAFVSGDVTNISPGMNKHLVWDGLASHPNMLSPETRIKIIVNEH